MEQQVTQQTSQATRLPEMQVMAMERNQRRVNAMDSLKYLGKPAPSIVASDCVDNKSEVILHLEGALKEAKELLKTHTTNWSSDTMSKYHSFKDYGSRELFIAFLIAKTLGEGLVTVPSYKDGTVGRTLGEKQ